MTAALQGTFNKIAKHIRKPQTRFQHPPNAQCLFYTHVWCISATCFVCRDSVRATTFRQRGLIYSTCFGCLSHPSSGVHQTVTAASGTSHSVRATTFRQRGLIYSTCFGCLSHPSSGVHQTVTAASGTSHSVRETTFCQRGLIRPRWRKVFDLTLWSVPYNAVTVSCTPDDGCDRYPKHVE